MNHAATLSPFLPGDDDDLLLALLAAEGFAAEAAAPAIPCRPAEAAPPLSFAQQRLWFLDQLEPGHPAYNIPTAVIHLSGRLEVTALARSLEALVNRHESLRTRFVLVDGQPVQEIGPASCALPLINLGHLPPAEQPEQVRRLALADACRSFDLAQGPLLRTTLLCLAPDRHVLLLTMHHIVSDGWSMGVFYRELAHFYGAFAAGQTPSLPPLPLQYADFAVWQRQWLSGEALAGQLAYWRTQLAEAPPVLLLPLDHPRAARAVRSPGSVRHLFKLSPELSVGLEAIGQAEGATLFMTLLAAFQLLLFRYTRQTDICVGSPIANRNRQEIEGLIGFFVNTLVLRTDLSGAPTFRQLLRRVRQVALEAYAHQDLPFEKLVETLQPERDLNLTPFFQAMFVLQNAPMPPLYLPELTMTITEVESGAAKFDLILELVQQPTGMSGSFEYDTSLFEPETIARMTGHFITLLTAIAANPDRPIVDVPLLTPAETRQLLVEWNQTGTDFPLTAGFAQQFEAQVARTPTAPAVASHGHTLSYAQLNGRANTLARRLIELGVGPEVVVALLAERGSDLLTMMLAVFKAGGAYLPLDPRHPPQRYRQILTQSQSPLVLTAADFLPALTEALTGAAVAPRVIPIEPLLAGAGESPNLPVQSGPDNLAYVIFTSGSTGQPKGAMVTQRGMLNHLWSKVTDLELTPTDVLAQNASQCFDISVWQFLAALLVGGQVHIFGDEVAHDPPTLLAEVSRQRITIFQLVPSMLRAIIQATTTAAAPPPDLAALRWVVPTGEALTTELCRRWLALYPNIPMLNAYGSTECSDDQCHHPIRHMPPPEYTLPTMLIGKAMANVQMYILDSRLAPVPIGVPGELYVGGLGVGRGYLNDPRRTAEVFIPDPFAPEPGRRLYKTGDLGRYRPDGSIEFLGRVDYMVKIRGFRIELGEIEAALARHPAVREAVVLARVLPQQPDDPYLAAYVVPETWPGPSLTELRAYLKENLPEYMLPAVFVPLAELPLTANGKINRAALPELDGQSPARDYCPPTNPVERVLAAMWAEVLGREQVSIDADFFQLGGHSLLATQLVFRVRAAFQVDLPLRDFFRAATVAELARLVEELRWGRGGSIGSAIDLEMEAQLPPDIQPPAAIKSGQNPSAIFLTGATGFLGAFLLYELLRQTGADIYCLVRAADAESGRRRLIDSLKRGGRWQPEFAGRLAVVVGDLAEPRLGLAKADFEALADKIEVIYHNGALVNFIYPYHRLRPANVGGTIEVLRLATRRQSIPVHYISTVSVFDSRPYFDGRTILETEEPGHATGLLYGYAQTKWVAEKLVAEAGRRGLPMTIYRPGTVIGDSQTGLWNNGDYLGRLISGCLQLGAFPALEQVLQMAPVDFVSRAVVYISRRAEAVGQVFHVVSPHKLKLRQLAEMLQEAGYGLSLLPYPEWQVKLIEAGAGNTLYAMLPLFVEWLATNEPVTLVELLEREPEYDAHNLHTALENSTIVCPVLEPVLLQLYLSRMSWPREGNSNNGSTV